MKQYERGQTAKLIATYKDEYDVASDPSGAEFRIFSDTGVQVAYHVFDGSDKISTGKYVYYWATGETLEFGKYKLEWKGLVVGYPVAQREWVELVDVIQET